MTEQLGLEFKKTKLKNRKAILKAVAKLRELYYQGALGGAVMPEDANPGLNKASSQNFHYFTLPMALNYQRDSYALWKSALATYNDPQTRFVFSPDKVVVSAHEVLKEALLKYKVALQPNRHIEIWLTICTTLVNYFHSDIRNFLGTNNNDITLILNQLQTAHKKRFPYLSGSKIANYWLYVMLQYTSVQLKNKQHLSIAPDTHVIQASIMLGVVDNSEDRNTLRPKVSQAWEKILKGTQISPIDIHTPLWLWSRNNFLPNL